MQMDFAKLLVLVLLAFSKMASAQSADELATQIEDVLTKRVSDAISPFVPPGAFTVTVQVKAVEPSTQTSQNQSIYMRSAASRGALGDMNKLSLGKLIRSASVSIGLPPKVSKQQQDEIGQIIKTVLPSTASLAFKKTKLAKQDDGKDQNLLRADNELRGVKNRLEDLKKERDDVKRESQLVKVESDKLARENAVLKNTKPESKMTVKDSLKTQAGSIAGYVLVFVALLVLGMGVLRIAKSLGSSVESLAGAVQSAGATLANAQMQTQSAVSLDTPIKGPTGPEQTGTTGNSGTVTQLAAGIGERISELKQELGQNLSKENLKIAREFIGDLLLSEENVPKSVLVFELMDRARAAEIFQALSQENQVQVMGFLRKGQYPTNKFELMIQAGEELKTKIVVENLRIPEAPETAEVVQSIKTISITDLYSVFMATSEEALPRLFSILDARMTSELISRVKRDDEARFDVCARALTKLPEAKFSPEQAMKFDPEIFKSMKRLAQESRSEIYRPFLKHYEEIIESLPSDLGEQFIEKISFEPDLTRYLKANIVTLATFFKVVQTQMKDVIDVLSTKEIAALMYGVNESDRSRIVVLIDEFRKEILQEELGRLEGSGKIKAEKAFKAIKTKVVGILKTFKLNGELQIDENSAFNNPPPPPSSDDSTDEFNTQDDQRVA